MRARASLRKRILLVGDGGGWILDQVARNLEAALQGVLDVHVVTGEWRHARQCLVHFVDRPWAWRDGVLDGLDASNQAIALWWHGRLDSPDPRMTEALARVRRIQERFARIQVPCSIARDTMLAIGVPAAKLILLPEGVDVSLFRPPVPAARVSARAGLGVPTEAFAIGSFQKDGDGWDAGDTPKLIKGPDVLADVLEQVARRHRVHAVIPGPSRGYLVRRLEKAGIPYSAPGLVEPAALRACYHALDAYISPSRDEGGPAGVLEGMASGVPVVSTRSGMAPDVIRDGVSGYVTDVDDVDALAARVGQLAEDAALRSRMGVAGRDAIVPYDWRGLARRYADELYLPLLGRSRG
jgi:glycosyltransferase involved in cell wall biosynthesis